VIVSTGSTLRLEPDAPSRGRGVAPLVDQVTASERAAIEGALATSRGRVSGPRGAARHLDMPASTLEFRIRKLGIDKFRFRRGLR
jgi:formate hydrogenlyase transcriptional activator